MNYIILIAFLLASISILLGFIALLKQKTYLDSKTNQPTDVEVPLVGRLKTNYPALVFVFLGFCLAFYVVHKSLPQKEIIWKITGSIVDPKSEINDWQSGKLCLFPNKTTLGISKSGKFDISITIPAGKSFEEQIEQIEYVHRLGSIDIYPPKEYTAHLAGEETVIKDTMPHMRAYKPVILERIQ